MEHSTSAAAEEDAFVRRFRADPRVDDGMLSFADFMDLALYDAEVGYYRGGRERIGRTGGADFYTSSSLTEVFGPLVVAAAESLLGAARAGDCEFIEIGAEPGRGVLDGVSHRFRCTRTVCVGEPISLHGDLVVFSNELFDAQPFHRVVYRDGAWREMGVRLEGPKLTWAKLKSWSPETTARRARLPTPAAEGHIIDLPLRAEKLARDLAAQPWRGLFLAFDYGRTWSQIATEFPAGTGRAYAAHRQTDDLLANPGAQDLTCHVCWDWLEETLRDHGFESVTRESQEAFFLRRAIDAVQRIVADDPNPLSRGRTQLKHLLHPALMGQRFEALWALRR